MARWIEKITGGKYKRVVYEAKTASAARAVIQDRDTTGMPHIEFKLYLRHPTSTKRHEDEIDEVVIYMTLADASKFVQEGISAIQAATPPIPGPAYRIPFG